MGSDNGMPDERPVHSVAVNYTAHGKQYVSSSIYVAEKENALPAARILQGEGYKVYSLQYDFDQGRARGTRQLIELR